MTCCPVLLPGQRTGSPVLMCKVNVGDVGCLYSQETSRTRDIHRLVCACLPTVRKARSLKELPIWRKSAPISFGKETKGKGVGLVITDWDGSEQVRRGSDGGPETVFEGEQVTQGWKLFSYGHENRTTILRLAGCVSALAKYIVNEDSGTMYRLAGLWDSTIEPFSRGDHSPVCCVRSKSRFTGDSRLHQGFRVEG